MTASTVPHAMPATMAVRVMRSVTFMPTQRKGSAPGMELQSSSYISLAPADEARHARLRLDPSHEAHEEEVQRYVEHGHRDERLVGLGRVVHELPAHGRELEEPDGRGHRRVLEEVEELG